MAQAFAEKSSDSLTEISSAERHTLWLVRVPLVKILIWFAELEKFDEIIVCVRRMSKVGKLLMGSTAQHVVLNSPWPVATIK